jgi:hypothetical protein
MPDREPAPSDEYEPNFVFAHINAIHEDNWAEYEAQGIVPLKPIGRPDLPTADGLAPTQNVYGRANVYTGDAWDEKEDRPLRHKPGGTVYVRIEAGEDPAGAAILRKIYREEYGQRARDYQARGGPASR